MFIVANCVSIAFLYVFPSVFGLRKILQHQNLVGTVHMNVQGRVVQSPIKVTQG